MSDDTLIDGAGQARPERRVRADAQRSLDALLEAARQVFAEAGVDAPVREIAERAGVGVGTVYRHFPQRSDLIAAVFRRGIDGCAQAATELAATHPPFEALKLWVERYQSFVATKRGLAKALHSGDPAYGSLRGYFEQHLQPAVDRLLRTAREAGAIRADIAGIELINAVAMLSGRGPEGGPDTGTRMIGLLLDGMRLGATAEDHPQPNSQPPSTRDGSKVK